jgi:hypothetical protein
MVGFHFFVNMWMAPSETPRPNTHWVVVGCPFLHGSGHKSSIATTLSDPTLNS